MYSDSREDDCESIGKANPNKRPCLGVTTAVDEQQLADMNIDDGYGAANSTINVNDDATC
jgi:hypothetical protein